MSDEPCAADEIMEGVYRALCRHGYAGLTMQDIADECSKSKSLLHYHYDTKEDLLVAFIDHLLADFEERVESVADDPPLDRLVAFVSWFMFDPEDSERESFHVALLEIRSQGAFNDRIQKQLDRSDQLLRESVEEIIREGIAEGTFEPVDVEETAALLVATVDGARTRQITLGDTALEGTTYTGTVANAILERIVAPMLTEGVEVPAIPTEADDTTETDEAADKTNEVDETDEAADQANEADETDEQADQTEQVTDDGASTTRDTPE